MATIQLRLLSCDYRPNRIILAFAQFVKHGYTLAERTGLLHVFNNWITEV